MSERIKKNKGITNAEQYLANLCERSFLSLWSYPNVFRDQGSHNKGDGKEVCDLLVVFENHIIIFSDKDSQFPNSGDLSTDWNRWFKRAIKKSAEQAWGAERWIRNYQSRLFLDRKCTKPFPIDLPNMEDAHFHLIVVAHDESARCQRELSGSGSLMICSEVRGNNHFITTDSSTTPFTIGDIDSQKTFIHVFDDVTLDIVMQTLDTISDFVNYLDKKEKFFRSRKAVIAAGEEDVLAYYLQHLDEEGKHDFVISPEYDVVCIDEGHWVEFSNSIERKRQIIADKISYMWDELIETFSSHAISNTHYYTTHPGIDNSEKLYRFLAREPRTRRRILARSLMELIGKTPSDYRSTRLILPSELGEPFYIFLLLPIPSSKPYSEYRRVRRELLASCCRITKLIHPEALDIIGIATETGLDTDRSEDVVYLDARKWTERDDVEARELQNDLGLLTQVEIFAATEYEYPNEDSKNGSGLVTRYKKAKGRIRNQLCPCKSGKKFKHCHGRRV